MRKRKNHDRQVRVEQFRHQPQATVHHGTPGNTEHDPTKPSACRGCGVTVPAGGDELNGWKVCPRCVADFIQPAADSELLGWQYLLDAELSMPEMRMLLTTFGVPWLHASFPDSARWEGNVGRFQHIDTDVLDRVRRALTDLRLNNGRTLSPHQRPCGWCGVAASEGGWTRSNLGADLDICAACEPWHAIAGEPSRTVLTGQWLLGCALGLRRKGRPAPAPVGSIDFAVKPWWDINPEMEATTERWEYLADALPHIRARLIRDFPKLATPAERAQIETERIAAARADVEAAAEQRRRVSVLG